MHPTNFKQAVLNSTQTWNGAASYKSTGSGLVDLFYASCRGLDSSRLNSLMEAAWKESSLDTLKIIAYIRDPREGKGERKLGREMLKWLATYNVYTQEQLTQNLFYYISEYGRWDDSIILLDTELQNIVIKIWGDQLKKDITTFSSNQKLQPSLLAKWIPSEGKSIDRKYNTTNKLVRNLKLNNASQLRKEYLTPLRTYLNIVEKDMCAQTWNQIDFNKVPSCAMRIYGRTNKAFERHLPEKFKEYKEGLRTGKTKVNASVLFPHEIVKQYIDLCDIYYKDENSYFEKNINELTEAQWKVQVNSMKEKCSIEDVIIMSDVSESMSGLPMQVSIALGLLISECNNEKWRDLVMTFHTKPQFVQIKGKTLFERVKCIKNIPWGGTTNFQSALDLVLTTGINNNLSDSEMPKKLLVISDMQFDEVNNVYKIENLNKTNYSVLISKYAKAGYSIPHLIFWNVNGKTEDFPTTNIPNVSLISGFSVNVLKAVLSGNITNITPYSTMRNIIDNERYSKIKIV